MENFLRRRCKGENMSDDFRMDIQNRKLKFIKINSDLESWYLIGFGPTRVTAS